MKRLVEVPAGERGSALVGVAEMSARPGMREVGKDHRLHKGAWDDPFAGAVQALMRQGIPLVPATFLGVSGPAAVMFSQSFNRPAADGSLVKIAWSKRGEQCPQRTGKPAGLSWGPT